jgi:glucose-6-phosphate-specific signal transduction histidine kinase
MTDANRLLLWAPRVVGILVSLFVALFALDAFSEGKSVLQALPDFIVHLAPALLLLAVVLLSWRREWIGALVFTCLAVWYAYAARHHPSWILAISSPLLLAGALFFSSWRNRLRTKTAR